MTTLVVVEEKATVVELIVDEEAMSVELVAAMVVEPGVSQPMVVVSKLVGAQTTVEEYPRPPTQKSETQETGSLG